MSSNLSIRAYLKARETRVFDEPPADWNRWCEQYCDNFWSFPGLYFSLAYFNQAKIGRRSRKWYGEQLGIWCSEQMLKHLDHHVDYALLQLYALGFVEYAGKHDVDGKFCGSAFKMCASPPPVPVNAIRARSVQRKWNEQIQKSIDSIRAHFPEPELTPAEEEQVQLLYLGLAKLPIAPHSIEWDHPLRNFKKVMEIRESKRAQRQGTVPAVASRVELPAKPKRSRGRRAIRRQGTASTKGTRSSHG